MKLNQAKLLSQRLTKTQMNQIKGGTTTTQSTTSIIIIEDVNTI